MFDINRHKFFMLQILKDIYTNKALATSMGFKGLCIAIHNPFSPITQ